jgi:hypothetical protein
VGFEIGAFAPQADAMTIELVLPCRLGLVVSSPPATEEIGAMVREIESRQDNVVALKRTTTYARAALKNPKFG